ncbi:MAG: YicC/YloC family endoribonuclease [Planctomycetota bacterium]|nr:YicC/YloC family endoribonuclease [Planctomycetota bacterium]
MADAAPNGDPVRSMTGASTFVVESEQGRIEAEARSVNHRFFKSTLRAQGPLPSAATVVEDALKKVVQRGHVTVHLRYRPAPATDASGWVDDDAFAQAAEHLTKLAARHGLGAVHPRDVLRVPGVMIEGRSNQDDDALMVAVQEAAAGVADALQTAREREGALMAAEVEDLLERIALALADIAGRAGEVPAAYRQRLQKRLEDLLQGSGVEPDPAQMARECAVLAEKSDVREEIARVEAHVQHARELLRAGGPVGRRLDFLVQELHREANTIASKTNDLDLSRTVLDLRAAIERLREQVQNLE